jgi:hypothetical protein
LRLEFRVNPGILISSDESTATSSQKFNERVATVIGSLRAWGWASAFFLAVAGTVRAGTLHVGSSAAWGIAADLYDPANPGHTLLHDIGDGAGNINPGSMLKGQALPYMYCLDLTHDIYLNADYSLTSFNKFGYVVNDDPAQNPASAALTTANGRLLNAGNIAYLMVHFASSATSGDQQLALQSAIWAEVYGKNYALLSNPGFSPAENFTIASDQQFYLDQIPNGGNANYISDVFWISPSNDGVNYAQNQVGYAPGGDRLHPAHNVPAPSTLATTSLMVAILGAAWCYRRLKQPTVAA